MLKGLGVILSIAVVVIAVITQPSFAGFDLGGMLEAGKDLTSAATLTDGQVKQLASEASQAYDQSNQVAPSSSPYAQRLAKLTKGMKIDGKVKPDIKVYLVKDVNAFAMADGAIRVFAGLMDQMTDDEVRYVIGHEIGHVSLGHSKKAFQTAYVTSAARKAGVASGSGLVKLSDEALGELAEQLVHAQYSQANENEADRYALKFMKTNGYDPKAAASALRKLEKMYGNDSSVFSSHPAPGDRAAAIEKAV